ncbi:hypothetical protein RvY_08717-1 [Ramazzottius varieornatus]|uniref:DNA-directed RNA polymerase II subunit RPB9-like zinc ribbon domain-containing protein n=1 Tax=Ramazzottius varieornatus TaxID=947166 RepID=A0A1D1V6U4_RAMVA|nr:hypothetical protein RvY_08717-1 [Ramazzottius varieornatus]
MSRSSGVGSPARPMVEGTAEGPGFVGIMFCQECNNMLYPRENKERKVLMYTCRNCDFSQEAGNSCVYVNKIIHKTNGGPLPTADDRASLPKVRPPRSRFLSSPVSARRRRNEIILCLRRSELRPSMDRITKEQLQPISTI